MKRAVVNWTDMLAACVVPRTCNKQQRLRVYQPWCTRVNARRYNTRWAWTRLPSVGYICNNSKTGKPAVENEMGEIEEHAWLDAFAKGFGYRDKARGSLMPWIGNMHWIWRNNVQVIFIIRESLFYFSFIHSFFIRISLYDIIF